MASSPFDHVPPRGPADEEEDLASVDKYARPTYLVGIGASAGGLEALESFFSHLPADSGMAFIVIQHLSPDFKSLMSELLARHTEMPIYRVRDGMTVEANAVYLIPPKKDMAINGGAFVLTDKDPQQSLSLPIDLFFHSLAHEARERAIAIVLSGTGSDGSRGIRSIHEASGLVLVQDERTAKFDGMPRSALATGIPDLVLAPEAMPEALMRYARHPFSARQAQPSQHEQLLPDTGSGIDRILAMLVSKYSIDFSQYKPTTVVRRIERRILLKQYQGLEEYVRELRQNEEELEALYKDLLIGVTRFFRDPEAFRFLETAVLPKLVTEQSMQDGFRVWVAGCATGEEPYSIAILLHELTAKLGLPQNFKIFATDAHRESLEAASAGVYNESSILDVTPERLQRYFLKQEGQFRISPEIRRFVVFAPQNVIKDPPFTKIDLLTCRNLLIYFKPAAQRKALSLFHFALNVGGVLFLGPSETAGDLYDDFEVIEQHWKFLQKKRDLRQSPLSLALGPALPALRGPAPVRTSPPPGDLRLLRAYDALLERFVPPSLLLNDRCEVVHSFGDASRYLKPPSGRASLEVLQLVRDELRVPLSAAIQKVLQDRASSGYEGIRIEINGEHQLVKLTVNPLPERNTDTLYLHVSFEAIRRAVPIPTETEEYQPREEVRQRMADLEQELQYTREHLSATVEELETSNEELQATNEELVASNEELQSTNEELHSVNEELYTVNAEYQNKIDELTQLTNDMDNLLISTDIGTVFLDTQFRIRRLTPALERSFHVLPQDVGRPIDHIASNLEHATLMEDLRQVLSSGEMIEREVRNRSGSWLLMRILPYRVETGAIEGVVVTFTDVSAMRRAQQDLRQSESNFRQLADFVNATFWLTSPDGSMIIYVSPGYERIWQRPLDSLRQNPASWLDALHPEDRDEMTRRFAARDTGEDWEAEYRIVHPNGSIRWIRDRRYPVRDARGQVIRLAGICIDVTDSRNSQRMLDLTKFAIDNAADMVFWMRPGGEIFYANEAASRALGYTRHELLQMRIYEIDRRPELATWFDFRGSVQKEGLLTLESELTSKAGSTVPVETNWTQLRFGSEVYFCAIARDTSSRHAAERELSRYASQLERANESLRQHNRELDEFAHLASHDLKEPLRAITTFSQLLVQDLGGNLPGDAVRDLEFITNASARMQRLVTDLLSLSRAGRADMRTTPVSLRACVESAIEALAVRVSETGARIEVGPLPEVSGDPTMLTQLYQNLIGNALKFCSSPGTPLVQVSAEKSVEGWVFSVKDNGIGIKPEHSEKIFQPFRRVHVKPDQEGTGIGLAICRKVVERHGGRIWVESTLGNGAQFLFTLPGMGAKL